MPFLVAFFVVVFIGTLVGVPWMLGRLPADYFLMRRIRAVERRQRDPLRAWIRSLLFNILGVILLIMGFIMLFLPGQGILTIIIGLGCMDFPGKERLLQRMIAHDKVQIGLNWLRRKQGREPFAFPDETTP